MTFARGAAILIHDAQYTPEEKGGPKAGWGHSSWEEAACTARAAAVGRLYLSHHDPDRSDRELSDILVQARDVFPETELAVESVSETPTMKRKQGKIVSAKVQPFHAACASCR